MIRGNPPRITSVFSKLVFRWAVGLIAFLLTASPGFSQDAPFYLKDGDTVVFYGDSITEQRLYTTFTETFVLTRFPKLKINFIHSGWNGDRVTGGGGGPIDLRLARDVLAYHPTVVTIMLGMNDGNKRPFDQAITDTYEKGYEHIVDELQTKLPGVRLTLIQPSPFDDVTQPPNFPGGYNSTMLSFGQFVKNLAGEDKQTTADFNAPVVNMLIAAKEIDPDLAIQLIPDRVHPSAGGHLIMAEALLKAWHAPGTVSDVEIDATQARIARSNRARIDDLHMDNIISWTETDDSLPMPTEPTDAHAASLVALALKSSDFTDALNREMLSVTGLTSPYYELAIDDEKVGVFSRSDLDHGINLATLPTPMMNQALAVHQLTVKHNDLHYQRWRSIQVPLLSKNNPEITNALPPILRALDAEEQGVVAQQRAKAQPLPHNYKLTPQETPGDPAGVVPLEPAGK